MCRRVDICSCLAPPSSLSCFSSSLPPILPSHSPSTRWRNGAQSTGTARSGSQGHRPDTQRSNLFPSGVGPNLQEQHSESTITEGTPLAELGPEANAIGDRRKSTETDKVTIDYRLRRACTAGIILPPKCEPTNQIRGLGLPARALPASFCLYKKRFPQCRSHSRARYCSGEVKVR